jgi:hypothetical protein
MGEKMIQESFSITLKRRKSFIGFIGITLSFTFFYSQPKIAGVAILSTGGTIPPNKTENLEVACLYEESTEMHPFRFRTHTHNLGIYKVLFLPILINTTLKTKEINKLINLGKLVSGYKVTRDKKGDDHWTKIGSRNPLDPQMFYSVKNEVTIRNGDILVYSHKRPFIKMQLYSVKTISILQAGRCTMHNDKLVSTFIG